jgi:hypothetical protein
LWVLGTACPSCWSANTVTSQEVEEVVVSGTQVLPTVKLCKAHLIYDGAILLECSVVSPQCQPANRLLVLSMSEHPLGSVWIHQHPIITLIRVFLAVNMVAEFDLAGCAACGASHSTSLQVLRTVHSTSRSRPLQVTPSTKVKMTGTGYFLPRSGKGARP